MNKAIFLATVEKGKLSFKHPRLLINHLSTIKGDVQVVIQKPRKDRSNQQNRYYWACLHFIAEELGYYKDEVEELHQAFKTMFLMDHTKAIPIPRSTTSLTTAEFTEYMNRIAHLAAENGVILPSPDYF